MKKDSVKRDGRVFGLSNIEERKRYFIHPSYELEILENARLSPTGHLVIVNLNQIEKSASGMPGFEFRWDEKVGELDIDPIIKDKYKLNMFKRSKNNCRGHHTVKIGSSPKVFAVDIAWFGVDIYKGEIKFGVAREVETRTKLSVSASVNNKIMRWLRKTI